MAVTDETNGAMAAWPDGSGGLAKRILAFDWASTPLGPIETWSQSLREAVGLAPLSGVTMPNPADGQPPRRGYGRELIERALPYQLSAETSYELTSDGVRCMIALPISTRHGELADA